MLFKKKQKGLTLIELLAVIAIIAILFVLLIPQINNAFNKTREVGVMNDFRSYQHAITSFFIENNNKKIDLSMLNNFLDKELKISSSTSNKKNPYDEKYEFITEESSKIVIFSKESNETKQILIAENKNNQINFKTVGFSSGENNFILETEDQFQFYKNNEGSVIFNYLGLEKNLTIPSTLGGKNVVEISFNAFKNKDIESVIFNDTLKRIEAKSFQNNKLSSITLPSSLEYIGVAAFEKNNSSSLTLSPNLVEVGRWAFAYNNIPSVIFPSSISFIRDYAFYSNQIHTLSLPNDLNHIGDWSFYNNKLTNLTINKNLVYIGNGAFNSNPNLKNVLNLSSIPNSNLFNSFNSNPSFNN